MTRVLCIGECMIELTHVDPLTLRLGFAGDTCNAAVYLRRVAAELGREVEVAYLTALGDDEYSDAMRAEWRDEDIFDGSLPAEGRLPSPYAIRTAQDGERRFAYWRDQSAAREVLSRDDLRAHLEGDVIHLSGTGPAAGVRRARPPRRSPALAKWPTSCSRAARTRSSS